jgi:hypothetical protein
MKMKIEPSLQMVWDMKAAATRATERMSVANALRHMKRKTEALPGLNRGPVDRSSGRALLVAERDGETYRWVEGGEQGPSAHKNDKVAKRHKG